MTPTWSHGYFTQDVYTAGFFRETAPSWLDFAALMQGAAPPRQREGEPFRYLDLGCGMGFHIALMAALYPEGEFIGVDFHPQHIAHGRGLAQRLGLANLQLHEADLLELQRDPAARRELLGSEPFAYVVSHGVATWVVELVQQALLAVASASLGPDGLFYCSYNTHPGWLSRSALHQLIRLQRQRCDPADPQAPIRWAIATQRALLGDPNAPNTPFGRSFPGMAGLLAQHEREDPRYVSQEYANDGWQPLYVAEMHERCAAHKLSPLTTATLTELFPGLLPAELRQLLEGEPNPTVRATLIDIAVNQSFRRDVFCRGSQRLTPAERLGRLGALRFRLQLPRPLESYEFSTSYGTVRGDTDVYRRAEAALAEADGPLELGAWAVAAGIEPAELAQLAAFLLTWNRIGLDRGEAGEAALAGVQAANQRIGELREAGAPYTWVGSPRIGNGVWISLSEQLLAQGLAAGLSGDLLATLVRGALLGAGAVIPGRKGEPLTQESAQLKALRQQATQLEKQGLAWLQSLGVVGG
ncbi:class I SAM-dependent methyltransferase [Cyanobium sp. CH-040]|uniref:class I SAM-dependent methyltransferase n=1 Tax=Cyanobium sp. CH-040 TaxID=2823708 RepID=UPI0020CD160E|nr:class I SAM-dependent methyltransferase [Cyanobium sp. CH-040]MCP9926357.1 methyltransferase regulatory domain-containing protein [Cyanobium sp. CH-040]